jgi:hypothetical protein
MAENSYGKTMPDVQDTDTTSPGGSPVESEGRNTMMAYGMGAKGLKGLFLMAACCAAPLLLLLALPVLGGVLGGRSVLVVSTLAGLACPIGMALMIWRMRNQRESIQQPAPGQPSSLPQTARTITSGRQVPEEATPYQD